MQFEVKMRVIAGKYKGRVLQVAGDATRPTLDRTKETLFNILQMRMANSVVLDLFAGSGQLAIECLSRGASRAILCDNDRTAQQTVKCNFQKIGVTPELYSCGYQNCLSSLAKGSIDIVFVDPPYKSGVYFDVLQSIDNLQLLTVNGIVVCEHGCDVQLPTEIGCLCAYDQRKIGSVKFTFYKRSEICQ